jgi:putative peptidoglycan lipid II flippase
LGEFRRTFSAALRAVFALSVPSAAALVVLAGPILRLLWRSGEFSETAVQACTFILLLYPASLIGLSGLQIVNRAFYSLKDRITPPAVGIGYTLVIVVLAMVLMRTRLQYAAIAAASSVGFTLGLLVLFEALRRRMGGIDGGAIARSFLRVVVASAALAAVTYAVSRWLGGALGVPWSHFSLTAPSLTAAEAAGPSAAFWQVAAQVVVSLAAGGVSYLLVLRLLGAPEIAEVCDLVRRRRPASAR